MPIQPAGVVLSGRESCAFVCDAENVTWNVPSNRGKIDKDTGVYLAPVKGKIWFATTVTVQATRMINGQRQLCGTATVLLSPGHTWIVTLWASFLALLLLLCWAVWFIWPPPAELPWVEVSPPVVTVAPGASQMFATRIWHTRDQDVTWSSTGGLITPNGLFTATGLAEGNRVVVTAARSSDHTLTGTALIIVKSKGGLAIAPGAADLLGGGTQQFQPIETQAVSTGQAPAPGASGTASNTPPQNARTAPANPPKPRTTIQWTVFDPDLSVTADGKVTAKKQILHFKRDIVTAADSDDRERQASALVYLYANQMEENPALPISELHRDRKLIMLVMLMGALGALLAASRSLANFVGNKTFAPRWSLYYLLRPLFGAGVAVIVFFGYRIGAITSLKDTTPADPFTAAFVAGIVGLFADTVLQKLKDTIDALLPAKNDERTNKLAGPGSAPAVSSAQGSLKSKQMTIKGQGFVKGAQVTLNDVERNVTFVDETTLTVALTDADQIGRVKVIVTNPDKHASPAFDGEIKE